MAIVRPALCAIVAGALQFAPATMDARAIIGRSVVASESDWRAEPNYDHFERDDDGDDAKTYDIRMIEGTPYERLIAVNDRPLSASRQREEQRQLEQAMAARKTESPDNRASRLDEDPEAPRARTRDVRTIDAGIRLQADGNTSYRRASGLRARGDATRRLPAAERRCPCSHRHDRRVPGGH